MDPFDSHRVDSLLPLHHPLRGRVHIVPAASSTQDLARQSEEIPSVWAAEIQTSGRGRQGRTWSSDQPLGLWCSVILEPSAHPLPLTAILGSLAAGDAIRGLTGLETCCKWPNDLMWNSRKLAGLLAETVARPGQAPWIILGLGLNLGHQASDFPGDLKTFAVSLREATGKLVPRAQMLAAFLEALTRRWNGNPEETMEDFRSVWGQQGRKLRLRAGDGEYHGIAEQVDDAGRLYLRLADGSQRMFVSGEADFPA